MRLGLRVDVDTRVGLREGVPRLLELLRRYSVCATFFVTFGPDRSGWAIRRAFRPSFLAKMWRTNPFRLYGLRTVFSGTLLKPLPVGEGEPGLLQSILEEGHELGVHGWDHVRWQDKLEKMKTPDVEDQLSRAVGAYERIIGSRPLSTAAPGWKATPSSLEVQDRLGFLYASDVRGTSAFLPVWEARSFKTLQLPTTLPTMDELLGRVSSVKEGLLSSLHDGLNIHTIHAEVEGGFYLRDFEETLVGFLRRNVRILRLREIAEKIVDRGIEGIPRLPVVRGKVPGRSGWVACQGPPG